MRRFSVLLVVLIFGTLPLCAAQQPASSLDQVLDRIISQERDEVTMIRSHSPMVETYVQLLAPDKALGTVPSGDKYFLGRAKFDSGVQLVSLANGEGKDNGKKGFLGSLFSSSM